MHLCTMGEALGTESCHLPSIIRRGMASQILLRRKRLRSSPGTRGRREYRPQQPCVHGDNHAVQEKARGMSERVEECRLNCSPQRTMVLSPFVACGPCEFPLRQHHAGFSPFNMRR
jgi:hypothetical protein